jgi:hypothetical protein
LPPNTFRTGFIATAEDGASVEFEKLSSNNWNLSYKPAPEAIRIAKQIDGSFSVPKEAHYSCFRKHLKKDLVVTHPLNTTATSNSFLEPRYQNLRTISFEGFGYMDFFNDDTESVMELLRGLPSGFGKDPYFGLGIRYDLRYLVDAIEEIDGVTDLRVRRGQASGLPKIDGNSYVLSARQFDEIRKTINRFHEEALSIAGGDKKAFVHNALLASIDPKEFSEKHRPYRKDAISEALGKSIARTTTLSKVDRETVLSAAATAVKSARKSDPQSLFELSREIEVVRAPRSEGRHSTFSDVGWQRHILSVGRRNRFPIA